MLYRAGLATILLIPTLCIGEDYFDYADVVDAEPIRASRRVPVREEVCTAPRDTAPPGDARGDRPEATIGELVRADDRRRRADCRKITRFELREAVTGWRVRYRYAGKTYVRRMTERPGKRIRVRVDLDPG